MNQAEDSTSPSLQLAVTDLWLRYHTLQPKQPSRAFHTANELAIRVLAGAIFLRCDNTKRFKLSASNIIILTNASNCASSLVGAVASYVIVSWRGRGTAQQQHTTEYGTIHVRSAPPGGAFANLKTRALAKFGFHSTLYRPSAKLIAHV
jgi:hypothetical protein